MNTYLSSSQETARANFIAFAEKEVKPRNEALDKTSAQAIKEIWQLLGQSGFLALTVPSEYGGQGAPFLNFILLVEVLAQYDAGLCLGLANHVTAIELLKAYGTENQKARYLPGLARGESIGTLAISEENAGTDYRAIETVYTQANGKVEVSGKKTMVANLDQATVAHTFARSQENGEKTAYLLVDLENKNNQAIVKGEDLKKFGLKSCTTQTLELKSLSLESTAILGSEAGADELTLYAFDIAQTVMAASAIGVAEGALQEAVNHAKSRQQFGKAIGQFQAIQWKLADLSTEAQAARMQTYRAAWAKDESKKDFRNFSAMSKWFAAKVARLHTGEALQVLGTQGIGEETRISRFYRDAKLMEILVGTSEFQKMRIVEELEI